MTWRSPTSSLMPQLVFALDQRSAVSSRMPFRARTTRRRMWKSSPVLSADNTSPTNTIGEEAKAWHGDWKPAQLQAAAGRAPAARNPAASTNARRQEDGRICLLNGGRAKSCICLVALFDTAAGTIDRSLLGLSVGRRGPVARRQPARPTPAAPAQLTADEAIEPAVSDDDQRAVVSGQSRERLRRDGGARSCGRNRLVAFAAPKHLRTARDQHPDIGRQPDRDAERLRKPDFTQRGLDPHALRRPQACG